MALDLADFNVRVNAITPGLIETNAMLAGFPNEKLLNDVRDHIPAKRFGTPEELAQAILFIASTDASYINGTTLLVDGGLGAREAGPVI
jgi:NAD(P)-dependent dehydrogenase (short-subunit alcohol dehydrogenase family)